MLGGPIGVYEVARYPFLKQEFAVIEHALKRGTPLIGICLGGAGDRRLARRPRLSGPRKGDRLGLD